MNSSNNQPQKHFFVSTGQKGKDKRLKDEIKEFIISKSNMYVEDLIEICNELDSQPCPDLQTATSIIEKMIAEIKEEISKSWLGIKASLEDHLVQKKGFASDVTEQKVRELVAAFVDEKELSLTRIEEKAPGAGLHFQNWNFKNGTTHVFDINPFTSRARVDGKLALEFLREIEVGG